jgi:nitrogen fixation protein NifU and related proteins
MILEPDRHAALSASCGDTIELFLRLDGSRIAMAAFMTNGCAPTVACGSMLTQMVRGLALEQAAGIDAADLIIALDGLPPEHVHCATLAVNALREAIGRCAKSLPHGDGNQSGGVAHSSLPGVSGDKNERSSA